MGRGLSELQKRILIAVYRLESPVCRLDDLRAKLRDVAAYVYGDAAKTPTNRAAFGRAVTRLQETRTVGAVLSGAFPNRASQGTMADADIRREMLYRSTPNQDVPALTDRQLHRRMWS